MNNDAKNNAMELEMLAAIAKKAYNSIILLDANGEIQWANKGFEKLYGYSLDEYKKVKDNENQVFINHLKETDRSFFTNNPALSFSRAIFTKRGSRKWVQSTLTPVISIAGDIKQFIVIESDITAQKDVEEELIQRQENTQTISEHLESVKNYVEDQIKELNEKKKAIEEAKEKSEEVLNKVLPYEVAIQLKKKGYATPRHYKKVTLLNINIRNFFDLANVITIENLVLQLHEVMVMLDSILEEHFVEKIKTVGGIYLGAGGVPLRNRSNPIDVALASLHIKQTLTKINEKRLSEGLPVFEIGYGVHTGKAIAGVVGKNKLSYDIWGDTVNVASVVEQEATINNVVITESTFNEIKEYFDCIPLKTLVLNNAEKVSLYELTRIKKEYASDIDGIFANETFMQILSKL